jgi:hypothetical protein
MQPDFSAGSQAVAETRLAHETRGTAPVAADALSQAQEQPAAALDLLAAAGPGGSGDDTGRADDGVRAAWNGTAVRGIFANAVGAPAEAELMLADLPEPVRSRRPAACGQAADGLRVPRGPSRELDPSVGRTDSARTRADQGRPGRVRFTVGSSE